MFKERTWEEKMAGIDSALDKLADMQQSVRVFTGGATISAMGNKWFDPQTLYFKVMPKVFEEKIIMLRMLGDKGEIPEVGRRHNINTYYLYVTPNQWKALRDEAIPMLR